MAEAAGLALGAASLAVELCKQSIWYINVFRDANDRTTQTSIDAERLESLLESIASVVAKLDKSAPGEQAEKEIVACTEAMKKIKEKLSSVVPNPAAGSANKLGKRILYPFRQEDLQYCKGEAEGVQHRLSLALQSLDIDRNRGYAESIEKSIKQESQLAHTGIREMRQDISHQTHTMVRQTQVLHWDVQCVENRVISVESTLQNLQSSLSSAVGDPNTSISAALTRLEAKLDNLTLKSLTPEDVREDCNDYMFLRRRVEKQNRSSKGKHRQTSCSCGGWPSKETQTYTRWGVQWSRTVTRTHANHCPLSAIEGPQRVWSTRLWFCSLALRTKAELTMSLARGAGIFAPSYAMQISRFVSEDSPAFKLIYTLLENREMSIDSNNIGHQLCMLYNTGRASPYDKLENGRSLLHYFLWQLAGRPFVRRGTPALKVNDVVLGFLRLLLDYMPKEALEIDGHGLSCVDYFGEADVVSIWSYHPGRVLDVVEVLHERGTTVTRLRSLIYLNGTWRTLKGKAGLEDDELQERWKLWVLDIFDLDDNTSFSEGMKACLSMSEEHLESTLSSFDARYNPRYQDDLGDMYATATRMGWSRGCELMYGGGLKISRPFDQVSETYLELAVGSVSLSTVSFWLHVRSEVDEPFLGLIGTPEEALQLCFGIRSLGELDISRDSLTDMIDTVMSAIIMQRRQIQSLAETHLDQRFHCPPPGRVLDTEVFLAVEQLSEVGITVPARLLPPVHSIYFLRFQRADDLECLYQAGFRDTGIPSPTKRQPVMVSPLLFRLTQWGLHSSTPLVQVTKWFTERGASLFEKWPGTELTTLHFLGHQLGDTSWHWLGHGICDSTTTTHLHTYIGHRQGVDLCKCACSNFGCSFSTMALKQMVYRNRLLPFLVTIHVVFLLEWIDQYLGDTAKSRHWTTEYIRLIIFHALGLQHTCCRPEKLLHGGEPDFSISPYRNQHVHNHDDQDDATEEGNFGDTDSEDDDPNDPYLLSVLENLIVEFEAEYQNTPWESLPLRDFYLKVMKPRLNEEISRIRSEDIAQYADGRRQMGIVMEIKETDGWD